VLRYMKSYRPPHEQLAIVSVVQREWAAKEPASRMRGVTPKGHLLAAIEANTTRRIK
jgi:hypothetical protein